MRRIGKLHVSEIGFGCWGIGGNAYGPTEDAVSISALKFALDQGVNFFDTSDFYGDGRSETVLSAILASDRKRVILATKGGLKNVAGEQDFTPAYLRSACENSLLRLKTNYIDLYQLHSPPRLNPETSQMLEDAVGLLAALKQEGKILTYGISPRIPEDAASFLTLPGIYSLQVNFNLMDQRARDSGLLREAAARGIGVIARTPLCFGFLTGKYSPDQGFAKTDHRIRWSTEQKSAWNQGLGVFREKLPERAAMTDAQFALCFCLSHPEISAAIPGMLTPEHVSENSKATQFPLFTAGELETLISVYRQHTFFIGEKPKHTKFSDERRPQ